MIYNSASHIIVKLFKFLSATRIVQPLNNNIQFLVNQYLKIIRQLTNQSNNINTQLLIAKYSKLSTDDIIGKRDDLRKTFFIECNGTKI